MQALKELCILVLDRGQKLAATERMRSRYRFVNQASSQRAKPSINRLMISERHPRTDLFDAPKICRPAQPRTIPHVRFALIDAHHTNDRIFHSGNKGLADDWDCERVEFIAVRSVEYFLFLTKNRLP